MSVQSPVHPFAEWSKLRLEEADAAIRAMEQRLRTLAGDAQLKAHLALLTTRKAREAFRGAVRTLTRDLSRDAQQKLPDLERAWASFEGSVENWTAAVGKQVDDLKARVVAHGHAWDRAISQRKAELAEDTMSVKQSLIESVHRLEHVAAEEKDKLRKLNAAGSASYAAWSDALARSRVAFDDALQATRQNLSKVAE